MTPERYEQIGRLYQAALEHEPAARATFLAQACGEDAELYPEVTSLLAADAAAGGFIEQAPDDVAAGWLAASRNISARRVAHYELHSLLGKGGMGEVWLAEDTQLDRKVAVKLLPLEFTTDAERVRRFAQEARSASALNHPNIITIHEIGQAENTHYLVTEYVAGETLRQRITCAPQQKLALAEALAITTQIAEALAAAHKAGITHRDIKPENVMVRGDGYVKVLDFGLAKLTEPLPAQVGSAASALTRNSTDSGVVLGTPRYMSPEQARGEKIDTRTDLFSFGVLLYEMLAGRMPFTGTTTSEIIAAILRDEPMPFATDVPPAVESIVQRALRKDRNERYQTADALLDDLNRLKERLLVEKLAISPSSGSISQREALSTSRVTSRARRGAHLALTAIFVSSLALAGMFYFNRRPALTEKDTILLADFENHTGDESVSAMLKQGLAIQLQQTPFLTLLPETQVRRQLTLMKRSANEHVTAELAREICVRENLKAFIIGSIAPLGSQYVITLTALNGQSGEELARAQEQATNKEQVLQALAQAATGLREKLGESLSSIQRFNVLPQEGTTAEPEAFKAYAQGTEIAVGGRLREAIPFYQRAVELDPSFAHSYSQLAIMYGLTGQPELAIEYAKRGYELKDRAGEIERFRITHYYHRFVTGDLDKQIETLLLQRRTYPREFTGPVDLAFVYHQSGQYKQALPEAFEAIRLNPNFAAGHKWLVVNLLRLNRFEEAQNALAQSIKQKIYLPDFPTLSYQLAFLSGDTTRLRQQIEQMRGKPDEYLAFDWQAQAAAFAGQWHPSQEFARRATDFATRAALKELAARYSTEHALRSALLGDCQQVKLDAARGLQLFRSRIALPRAALALALCGEVKQTQFLTGELGERYAEDTLIRYVWLPVIRAAIELQQRKATRAIELLQEATRYEAAAEFWPQYLRGQAYLQARQYTEAAAEFQKILDHRGYAPLSPLYPLAQLGLARATQSRQAYDEFFARWKEADADLPILLTAHQEAARL